MLIKTNKAEPTTQAIVHTLRDTHHSQTVGSPTPTIKTPCNQNQKQLKVNDNEHS